MIKHTKQYFQFNQYYFKLLMILIIIALIKTYMLFSR